MLPFCTSAVSTFQGAFTTPVQCHQAVAINQPVGGLYSIIATYFNKYALYNSSRYMIPGTWYKIEYPAYGIE